MERKEHELHPQDEGHKHGKDNKHRHEAKYRRIVDAALRIFARKGFHQTKISEIARAAAVADGTIYIYFKNKDDLLVTLAAEKLREITEGLGARLQRLHNHRERLVALIAYHIQIAVEQPDLVAFLTGQLRGHMHMLSAEGREWLAAYLRQWGDVIEAGKQSGEIRSDLSTKILQLILFGALDYACDTWVHNPERRPEELEEVGLHLQRMLLAQSEAGRSLHR